LILRAESCIQDIVALYFVSTQILLITKQYYTVKKMTNGVIMKKKSTHSRRSEQLRETIQERIATGFYQPGSRLDECELANEFGVSRTPVREALIQLSFYGLIDMRPRLGAIVTEITPLKLCEMFEVMAELEAMCARLAARRMSKDDRDKILSTLLACEESLVSGDPDAFYVENERFHLAIYSASHNSFLIEKVTELQKRLCAYRRLQLRVRDRLKTANQEHAAVVEAIVAGDGEKAAELLRKHVTVQGDRFADLLSSLSTYGIGTY
jgi:DNA-binding GntR family transcriptional regulator